MLIHGAVIFAAALYGAPTDDADRAGGCYVELCSYRSQSDYVTHRLMKQQLDELRAIRRLRNDGEYEYEHPGSNSCAAAGERPCDDLIYAPNGEGD